MTAPLRSTLQELEARCARAGLPLTAQRRAVMQVLATRCDHPTVDQIYTAVLEQLPDLSKATVYRSLETLTELGLIARVDHPNSAVRYDANMEPHHHFFCRRCSTIVDVPLEAIEGHEALRFRGADGERAEGLAILVRGLCPRCAAEVAEADASPDA